MTAASPETPSAGTTAMSLSGSVAPIANGALPPSLNATVVLGGSRAAPAAAATTWALVMMRPSGATMMPDPSWSVPPPKSVFNVTTLGNILAATCSSEEVAVDSEVV